jgi:hypothetical protein
MNQEKKPMHATGFGPRRVYRGLKAVVVTSTRAAGEESAV